MSSPESEVENDYGKTSPSNMNKEKNSNAITTQTRDIEENSSITSNDQHGSNDAKERAGRVADEAALAHDALYKDDEKAKLLKSGTRKLDWVIVPPLLLMWLANFVDRSNAGNARIAGMTDDLGMEGLQFNTALAVFYVTYILVELPSNIILKKVGGNIWLPTITFAWGAVTACTAATQNYAGFLIIRLVLGACEGGLLGGITLYLSTLYPRFQIQQRIARFYSAAALAGSFGGLLASGLTSLDTNGIRGWRWLYIVEGVITCGFAIFSIIIMPNSVLKTRYLNENERKVCQEALEVDVGVGAYTYKLLDKQSEKGTPGDSQDEIGERTLTHGHNEQFEWYEVQRGALDIQTWLTGLLYLCVCCSLYSITLFLPTILRGVFPGATQTRVQLLTVPPFVPAAVMVLIVAWLSDKTKMRGPYIMAFLPIAIVGYIILVATKNNDARYAAVFLICFGIYPAIPCILTLIANNSSGHYKRATSTAMQLMIANGAGFIATFIYDADKFGGEKGYVVPHAVVLAFLCLGWICITLNVLYCYRENSARAAGKRDGNIAAYENLVKQGITKAPIGDRHPGFRFSL